MLVLVSSIVETFIIVYVNNPSHLQKSDKFGNRKEMEMKKFLSF